MRNLGMLLLGIWLIVTSLVPLLGISFPSRDLILALLGLASGVLLLVDERGINLSLSHNLGMLLLSAWLIVTGLFRLLNIYFPSSDVLLALLALVAGIALLAKR